MPVAAADAASPPLHSDVQVSNHPFLLPGAEENAIKDANLPTSVNHAMVDPRIHELLVESSGKLQV
jgi:hypothetical protein